MKCKPHPYVCHAPRGIILAVGRTKEEIEAIMQEDPFCTNGLAEVTVTEFLTSQTHPGFKKLLKEVFGG